MPTTQGTHHGSMGATTSVPTHVWDYWAIVMKRGPWVLAVLVVSLSLAYFITGRQKRLYRAQATIYLVPPSVFATSGNEFVPAMINDEKYLATQLLNLTSQDTIQRAVRDAKLATLPDFQGKSESDIAAMAMGNVECSPRRGVYLVDVAVIGQEAKVLKYLANALVETFKDMQKSEARSAREDHKAELEAKLAQFDQQKRLCESDKARVLSQAQFIQTTFTAEYEKIKESRERWSNTEDELIQSLSRDEEFYKVFKQAQVEGGKAVEALGGHAKVLAHPEMKEMLRRIEDQKDRLTDLKVSQNYGNEHPSVRLLQEQIDRYELNRIRLAKRIVEDYVTDYEARVKDREHAHRQSELKLADLNQAAAVKSLVDEKDREIDGLKDGIASTTRQRDLITAAIANEKDTIRISQRAQEPQTPYSPNMQTNMMLGLVFGILGGVALAFLLDYLDDTIRTKDELAKIAPEVPLLGIVPNIEARKNETQKKDLYAANQPKSTISEAYRGVRTALTLSARGPLQKSMLLTSAGPREGKTTTAINLATVLAFSGARTLIIDADLRKPRIHASFNLPNRTGLTNLIVGEREDPLSYCQRTHLERVDVLVSGPIPPNPSELLGRPRMREIIAELSKHYDQIIVDTPPIGAVTDAAVIAKSVDGVVLVVHAGKTRRQIVSRGIEQLRYIGAPIVGVILNNLRLGRGRYYPGYYHYYYYYASHYGADEREAKRAAKAAAAEAKGAEGPPER